MAIIERPDATPATVSTAPAVPAVVTPSNALGVFKRPVQTTGWKSWIFTVDHKKLGIMYGVVAMFFFLVGGLEALLIRLQLAAPDNTVLDAGLYNEMFTMHATTMVFLFVMPMAAAFANYFLPLQIGARDVAFPRINAFGFWAFLFGGVLLNTSWFLGGAADGGWFMYSPNSSVLFSPTNGVDFWVMGLQITGIASLIGAINLIVTVLNMRAPGMKLMQMPMFTWMVLVVQFLLAFAMPVITVALFLLTFQRNFGAAFFDVSQGADPLLWQHLFWIFGHPEVYIIILPSFGIISEVLPTFARKPLFGYKFVVFSGAAIGFVGWGVWAHHMFASGLGPVSVAVFSVATMLIAIPTGVKIVNWTLTLWGGKLWFTTAMKFAIGVIVLFTIGGVTGVTHSVAPADTQQTDTYHVVGHFHYVIVGGAVMGLFAGFYYWWPKMFGRMLNERLGSWNFWLMFFGINLTFGPMHILGMQGQPRRMVVWPEKITGEGFFDLAFWNRVATVGSFVIALGVLLFIINIFKSAKGPKAPLDPWDARTLEWLTSSPPKEHNFDRVPTVHALDEYFHRKYEEVENPDGTHSLRKVRTAEELQAEEEANADKHIHLPSPSYWPIVLAFGLPVIAYGIIFNLILSFVGLAIVLLGMFGWALEPSVADDTDYDPPAGGDSKELATLG
ncbi:MAG: cytochrome c oxidase subunit I [Ilumatobacteraceae bacterium]